MHCLAGSKYPLVAVVICAVFTVFGLAGFHQQHNDYIPLMEVMLERNIEADRYFAIPIAFYKFFDAVGIGSEFAAKAIGLLLVFYSFRKINGPLVLGVSLIIMLPGPMLYLGIPSKEHFLVASLILYCYLLDKGKPAGALVLLFLYSVFFRLYVLAYVGLSLIQMIPKYLILLLLSLIAIASAVFFDSIIEGFSNLLARRDVFYNLRSEDVRSAWYNPYEINTLSGQILNYCYAFLRLNTPVIFEFGPKEVFLQIYIVLVIYCIALGFAVRPYVSLGLLAMFFLYPVFELDLGSYLRHLSSWFPMFIWLLTTFYERYRFARGDG